MSLHLSSRLKFAAAWAAVGLLGALGGWLNYRAREAAMLKHLIGHARLSAVAVPAADLERLRGAREDVGTPLYRDLKDRLRRLKSVEPSVRFVYIFRAGPGAKPVIFLGDSAEPGAKDESLPGDNYPQAPNSPGLQEILRTGLPATEGPLADDFGTWMTAYAPVGNWTSGEAAARHVLGVDIDAGDWRYELWQAGLAAAGLIWLGLGLPLGFWRMNRRQREQNEVIRNLSEAMEQSHSAIMIIDPLGCIEYANRGLGRQTGFSRRELFGRSWRELHAPDDPKPVVGDIDACLRAGREWEGEWLSCRKDGSTLPVRGGYTPVKHRDGTIACFVAVFDDVTESRRREAELREATELARAGDKAKGQFLATMSHEVRTPLNGIVGFTNLLLDTALSAEQREYVQTVRMSAEALIQLTGDILDFARIESGKLKLDPAPCDPREGVEDALDLLATKAADKGIELLHDISPEVPSLIQVDGGRLRQVLVNLIGNAVKFTERGEIAVSLRVGGPEDVPPLPDGGVGRQNPEEVVLVFAVRDTGIGIAPEHHSKLFRAFSQVDDSMTRRYGGTGLGLAVSRNLVELMGGRINVASGLGQGSTFTFSIRAPVAGPRPVQPDLSGCRILIVAAVGSFRREIADLVRSRRGEVTEAETLEALAGGDWDTALVEVTAELGSELAARTEVAPGWVPERTFGIVPISASNQLRTALRRHFRLLVNKPVHHDTLCSLLGKAPAVRAPKPVPAVRFGLRVLVVEDNPVNQRVIKRVLENLGCTTALAENGREALDVLAGRGKEFDLVLLDLHMPVMDGITAVAAIRNGQAGPEAKVLPVVALTADARDDQRQRGLEAGLDGYLTKPLNVSELTAVLGRFPRRGEAPAP